MATARSEAKRPKRQSINGSRNVLGVSGKEAGFEYRIVNDTGDRIAQFEELGWEVVKDTNIKVGDRRVANPTSEGSAVKVSVGGGVQAYVMRMRKDWYDENQAEKQEYVDRTESAMKADAKKGSDFGSVKFERD